MLQVAVEEVVHKVLSEPIRPQFAIACVGVEFSLEVVHHLVFLSYPFNFFVKFVHFRV